MEDANLNGADLGGADLKVANLEGAYLKDANLKDANLEGAYLIGANLYGANLIGANLYGANLIGANLKGAILEGADLTGAILRYVNLEGAKIDLIPGHEELLKKVAEHALAEEDSLEMRNYTHVIPPIVSLVGLLICILVVRNSKDDMEPKLLVYFYLVLRLIVTSLITIKMQESIWSLSYQNIESNYNNP